MLVIRKKFEINLRMVSPESTETEDNQLEVIKCLNSSNR